MKPLPDILIDLTSDDLTCLPLGLPAQESAAALAAFSQWAGCAKGALPAELHARLGEHGVRSLWAVGSTGVSRLAVCRPTGQWLNGSGAPLDLAVLGRRIAPPLDATPAQVQGRAVQVSLTPHRLSVRGAQNADAGALLGAWLFWCGLLPHLAPPTDPARYSATREQYAAHSALCRAAAGTGEESDVARRSLLNQMSRAYLTAMLDHRSADDLPEATGFDLFVTVFTPGHGEARLPGYVVIEGQQLALPGEVLREPCGLEGQSAQDYARWLMERLRRDAEMRLGDLLNSAVYVRHLGVTGQNDDTPLRWYELFNPQEPFDFEGQCVNCGLSSSNTNRWNLCRSCTDEHR